MAIQTRIDTAIMRLKTLLDAHPVKHLDNDNISQERLHKALLYLSDRTTKTSNQREEHDKELRRCIADVLLLIDGVDIHDKQRIEERVPGTKQSPSITTD